MPKRSKNKVPTQKVKHLYNSQPKVPKLSKKFIIRHRRNLKYQKIYIIRHRRCPQFRNIVKRHRRRARGVWGGGSPPGKVWWIFAIHRWAPKEQWWKQMVPVVVFLTIVFRRRHRPLLPLPQSSPSSRTCRAFSHRRCEQRAVGARGGSAGRQPPR